MNRAKAIINDAPFQVGKRRIAIGVSSTGYTLKHFPGYDGVSAITDSDWSVYDPTGGNGQVEADTINVVDVVPNDFYRLVGNTGTVLYQ